MFRLAIVFLVIVLIAAGAADYVGHGSETIVLTFVLATFAWLGGSFRARPSWTRWKARRRQRAT